MNRITHFAGGLVLLATMLATSTLVKADTLTQIGHLPLTGVPAAIMLNGGHAYVAAGEVGIHVIDISDPAVPVLITTLDTPGDAMSCEVYDHYLYVADGAVGGLQIYDISNPNAPVKAGAYDTLGNVSRLRFNADKAYLCDRTLGGFEIVDLDNPVSPAFLNAYYYKDYPQGLIDVVVDNGIACATYQNSFDVIDVTDPLNLQRISSLLNKGGGLNLAKDNGNIYKSNGYNLSVLNVQDPVWPFDLRYEIQYAAVCVKVDNRMLYYVHDDDVVVCDIASSRIPLRMASLSIAGKVLKDLAVSDGVICVLDTDGGLHVVKQEPTPFIRLLEPETRHYLNVGETVSITWNGLNYIGNVDIVIKNRTTGDEVPIASGIPVDQGAAGLDYMIPSGVYQYGQTDYEIIVRASDGSTASRNNYVFFQENEPDTLPSIYLNFLGVNDLWTKVKCNVEVRDESRWGVKKVEVRINGGPWETMIQHGFQWDAIFDIEPLDMIFDVRAVDNTGRVSDVQTGIVKYEPEDEAAPTVKITSHMNGQAFTGDAHVILQGIAEDWGTPVSGIDKIRISSRGEGYIYATGKTEWAAAIDLYEGENLIQVVAFDKAGNKSNRDIIHLFYTPGDTAAPSVTITNPENQTRTNNKYQKIEGTAADADSGIHRVEYSVNRAAWQSAFGKESWYCSPYLTPGANIIEVRSVDNSSNYSTVETLHLTYFPDGTLTHLGEIGGACQALAMTDETIYLGEGRALRVLDPGDGSEAPMLAFKIPLHDMINRLVVDGDRLYIAIGARELQIYDIADPFFPEWVASYRMTGPVNSIIPSGDNRLWMTLGDNSFSLFDVTDPARLKVIQKITPISYHSGDYEKCSLELQGDRLIFCGPRAGVCVYSLNGDAEPVLLGHYDVIAELMAVDGDRVVVAKEYGLNYMDISDPGNINEISGRSISADFTCVDLKGTTLYASTLGGSLVVYDCKATSIDLISSYATNGAAYDFVTGELPLIYATADRGLDVIDTSLLPDDKSVYRVNGYETLGPIVKSEMRDENLSLASTVKGLHLVDTSDPFNPRVSGSIELDDTITRINVDQNLVAAWPGNDPVSIIDIADPAHPVLKTKWNTNYTVSGILLRDGQMYVGKTNITGAAWIEIYTLGEDSVPVLQGSINLEHSTGSLSLTGDTLLATDMSRGIRFIDVSDPAQPVLKGTFAGSWHPGDGLKSTDGYSVTNLSVLGDWCHATRAQMKFDMINIRDIEHPVLLNIFTENNMHIHNAVAAMSGAVVSIEWGNAEYLRVLFMDDQGQFTSALSDDTWQPKEPRDLGVSGGLVTTNEKAGGMHFYANRKAAMALSVDYDLPEAIYPNQELTVPLTVKNIGMQGWSAGSGLAIGPVDDPHGLWANENPWIDLDLAASVDPGGTTMMDIPLKAPAQTGTYIITLAMKTGWLDQMAYRMQICLRVLEQDTEPVYDATLTPLDPITLGLDEERALYIRATGVGNVIWPVGDDVQLRLIEDLAGLWDETNAYMVINAHPLWTANAYFFVGAIRGTPYPSSGKLKFRMARKDGTFFGEPLEVSVTVTGDTVDQDLPYNARLEASTVPSRLMCGSQKTVQLNLENNGRHSWFDMMNCNLMVLSDEGGLIQTDEGHIEMPTLEVKAGETCPFTLEIKTPDQPGRYVLKLRMAKNGELFGTVINLAVRVVDTDWANVEGWMTYQ